MAYRNLAIKVPNDSDVVPSYIPSPRDYDTITKNNLSMLQKINRDLVKRLEATERAPQLVKNLVSELDQANARVQELRRMLKSQPADDNKEDMANKLQDSKERAVKLENRLVEIRRKNLALQRQLNTKPHVERDFTKAVKDMDVALQKLAFTKHRTKTMEKTLETAKEKRGELRAAKSQIKSMQRDLDEANEKLGKLRRTLDHAQKKWDKRERDVTRVQADGTSYGQMTAKKTDIYGRATRDGIKVVELKDKGKPNIYASKYDYANRTNKEIDLIRSVEKLELTIASVDRLSKGVADENEKMADEVQKLMKYMAEKGLKILPGQVRSYTLPHR
jgi:predicted  nucleic acid-binding Zn-ribbon protein